MSRCPSRSIVAHADPHAGHLLAVRADGDAAHQSLFAKGAVVVIQQQKALRGVAGHKEIGPPVLVDIEATPR